MAEALPCHIQLTFSCMPHDIARLRGPDCSLMRHTMAQQRTNTTMHMHAGRHAQMKRSLLWTVLASAMDPSVIAIAR